MKIAPVFAVGVEKSVPANLQLQRVFPHHISSGGDTIKSVDHSTLRRTPKLSISVIYCQCILTVSISRGSLWRCHAEIIPKQQCLPHSKGATPSCHKPLNKSLNAQQSWATDAAPTTTRLQYRSFANVLFTECRWPLLGAMYAERGILTPSYIRKLVFRCIHDRVDSRPATNM